MKYKYDPPLLIKKIFSDFNWNTINNKILLTFDDGPIPETTELILKTLKKHEIKSLFFCVGNNVKKYPELVKKILDDNHLIGNHTFHHKILTKLQTKNINDEIDSFTEIVKDQFNYKVKYFRPPHGRFNKEVSNIIRERKLSNVMWSLLTYDYKNDLKLVKFAVKKYLKNNSIIVLHDSLKSKDIILDSIKFIAEEVNNKNYEFGKPDECLK